MDRTKNVPTNKLSDIYFMVSHLSYQIKARTHL